MYIHTLGLSYWAFEGMKTYTKRITQSKVSEFILVFFLLIFICFCLLLSPSSFLLFILFLLLILLFLFIHMPFPFLLLLRVPRQYMFCVIISLTSKRNCG